MTDISYLAAFGAGVLSFISPCVLPLVPGYISYISGVSFDEMRQASGGTSPATRRQLFIASVAFVLGFSLVFILFGASASAIGHTLSKHKRLFGRIAGALIVLFGLHLAGIFRLKWLDKDTRVQTKRKPVGPLGAAVVGMAFAFGWTPCIGPILGGILGIAASKDSVGQGIALLAVYSLGLGVPFLLTSIAIDRFFIASARIRRHYKVIETVAGILLIVLGILIFTNSFTILSGYFSKFLPTL